MIDMFANILRRSKLVCYIYRFIKYYILHYYVYTLCILKPIIFLRKANLIKGDENLKKYYNCHAGKRCFIVATGPSLQIEDLEKLKNEITFSMNSIVLAFNKTSFRPTYYGIQDKAVYEKLKEKIVPSELNTILTSHNVKARLGNNQYEYTLYLFDHLFRGNKYNYPVLFSDDVSKVVYDGGTVAYSMIQFAVYMGIKEIYLLGTDCDYSSNEKEHFIDYMTKEKENKYTAANSMLKAYKFLYEYSISHDIHIYNATRGGKLEIFPRVDFDSLLV